MHPLELHRGPPHLPHFDRSLCRWHAAHSRMLVDHATAPSVTSHHLQRRPSLARFFSARVIPTSLLPAVQNGIGARVRRASPSMSVANAGGVISRWRLLSRWHTPVLTARRRSSAL